MKSDRRRELEKMFPDLNPPGFLCRAGRYERRPRSARTCRQLRDAGSSGPLCVGCDHYLERELAWAACMGDAEAARLLEAK